MVDTATIDYLHNEIDPEWEDWYRLTPAERWNQTDLLWQYFLSIGGSLDKEPDPESPFFDAGARSAGPADGWAGVRVLRRSGI